MLIFRAILLLLAIALILGRQPKPECTCSTCYRSLESALLDNDGNMFNMTRAFYPPYLTSLEGGDRSFGKEPAYATIIYWFEHPIDIESNDSQTAFDNDQSIWFWGESEFYLLQPIRVFQWSSLFFGKTWFHSVRIHLTLPTTCINASNDFLELLTHRVCMCLHICIWFFFLSFSFCGPKCNICNIN